MNKKIKVCIDAGHGYRHGRPSGASGIGLYEDDLVWSDQMDLLGMQQRVAHLLRREGHRTVYTRNGRDALSTLNSLDLSRRVATAKANKADLFISLHCNSVANPTANGFEVFAHAGQSKSMLVAQSIAKDVGATFSDKLRMRGAKLDTTLHKNGLYVLRKLAGVMPAVLVECGFLTNGSDNKLLRDRYFRQDLAAAIVRAALKVLAA